MANKNSSTGDNPVAFFILSSSLNITAGNLTIMTNGDIGNGEIARLTVANTTTISLGTGNASFRNINNDINFLNVTSARDFTLNDSNGLTIGTSTLTGNLTINANGSIADNGIITVSGASSVAVFNANLSGANGDVSLDTVGNDFNIINVTAANVTIRDSNAVSLGESNVTGDLNVTAGGAVTDSGALNVTGTASINANSGMSAITLDNSGNDFNTVELTGSDVVVTDRNGIDLGASTVIG